MKRLFTILLSFFIFNSIANSAEPKLSSENSFTLLVLGDPQNYSKYAVNQPMFEFMTAWIAENSKKLNIKSVLCVGDLVEQNDLLVPTMTNGDQTSHEQWKSVSRAFERLDGVLPYIVCGGNHDYGYLAAENRNSELPKWFNVQRNSKWKGVLVDVCNNYFGRPTLENAAYEIDGENLWGKILIISLEFAPRDEVLTWAKNLAESQKYKNHKVIILTHSYLDIKGGIIAKESYKLQNPNWGKDVWEKLVSNTPNIKLLICGHIPYAFRKDVNNFGKNTFAMMFNTQADGFVNGKNNGGDGYLRILEFMPDGKTIKASTYSPILGYSSATSSKAWRKGNLQEFEFQLE